MKNKGRKKVLFWFWTILLLPVVGFFLLFLGVGLFSELPSFEELENPKSNLATEVISEDGVIMNTFHIENRVYVSFEELSPNLVNAALATEDIRFYKHSGIDFRSLSRVVVKTLLMRDKRSGGGSTITQQLAKTLYPRDTTKNRIPGGAQMKLVTNKLKEWITAVKLERNYSKNEIISMYMNAIFFGSEAYGIKVAANTFFAKEPIQLNVEESALLVGMVNKPTRYNPIRNPEQSLLRRNHVLSQMEKYGFLSHYEHDSIAQLPITLQYSRQDHNAGLAPYFRDMLRRVMRADEPKRTSYTYYSDYVADSTLWAEDPLYGWLNKNYKPDGSKYNLDKDGLKIYTTLNSKMQRYAQEAVEEHLGKELQAAFFREMRSKPYKPFGKEVTKEQSESLLRQARRWSDRYRNLKSAGLSDKEIEADFNKKYDMRVFSWNKDGYVDTLMSPNDSIKYYKSILRASIIAMEPQTGQVKAYVGGPNYRYFKYDNARQSKRQVGSTFKPFMYTLAMQEGMTPCDRVFNIPRTFIVGDTTWTPRSTDKPEFIGTHVTLKWGLTNSSNNISAYLMERFGPRATIEMCRKLGIHSYLPDVPSLCLGPADISPFEIIAAYNTFPSRGVFIEPFFVERIEDNQGNVLATFNSRKREAMSEQTAYLMVNLMEGVVNEGTAYRLRWKYNINGSLAGKTGTTNDQSDGWFIGYMPRLTAGVWVGAEDRQAHFETLALGSGGNMALPIWGIFMQKVLNDGTLNISSNDRFTVPPGFNANLDCDGSDIDNIGDKGKKKSLEDTFFNY